MQLAEIHVRPVIQQAIPRYHDLMQAHHYLGAAAAIGETLCYIALWRSQWIALISFSSAALKCATRDQWIGWRYRHQFDRLHLVTNNSRFLILPQWHFLMWPHASCRCVSGAYQMIGWHTLRASSIITGNLRRPATF